MKWRNKGHEFDCFAKEIVQNFRAKGEKIYIFGAGLIGEEIRPILEKTGYFCGFIDNDTKKQAAGVNGAKVISLQDYLAGEGQGLVIIAADTKNIPVITKQLADAGLREVKDFYDRKDFMKNVFPVLTAYANDQIYVELAQICLTERCTLKCRNCAHGCYAVDSGSQDMSVEMAKESADSFFAHVDIVAEFVLIGGEPFLYRHLGEMIAYIGERYRDKIVVFAITTNGTILPDRLLLDLCKKYDITIRISDYSATITRLEKQYELLKEVLAQNQISYSISGKETQWMDYGFEMVDRNWQEKELIGVFDRCKTPCREIRGSRYYYCVMARSVSENLSLGLGAEDYLDLKELETEDRKILLEFQMGYSEKGYLDLCNHCNGADAVNYPIPAAEQVKTNNREKICEEG